MLAFAFLQVVVAFLMATENLSVDMALHSVKQIAPWICPNPGFMHQLALFAEMQHSLKPDYPPYRTMLLSQRRQMATLNARPLPKTLMVLPSATSCSTDGKRQCMIA